MAIGNNPNPLFAVDNEDKLIRASRIEQSTMYSVESQLIRGTMSFSKDKLQELDPSYTGYTHIFVLRMPPFIRTIAEGNVLDGYDPDSIEKAKRHFNNLKAMIELGSTSYSGTPDLTLNTSEVNTGFSERSYPAPTFSQYDGKSFSIRALETRGEPLRRAMEYWINGISDANVKATMMHGALDANKDLMDPTLSNYTMSLMVVQTDQTLLRIQDISLWNSVTPTGIDRSNLDWENGSIDIVQPRDLQFQGVYMPDSNNDFIYNKALALLGARMRLYRRFEHMDDKWLGTGSWGDNYQPY